MTELADLGAAPRAPAGPERLDLAVTLEPLEDRGALGQSWRRLEARSRPSFFRSWAWIGCWLDHLPARVAPRVLRVAAGTRLVGLAILVAGRTRRHRVVTSRLLCLNETGDPRIDPLGLEYNGLLAETGREQEVDLAAVAWLARHETGWDELYLGGLDDPEARSLRRAGEAAGLDCVVRDRQRSDFVDLAKLRAGPGDLLAVTSANTRYQVRRARRLYESQGPLTLRAAETPREALAFLGELKALHQDLWHARGQPGAFARGSFEAFHHDLVAARFTAGNIQLLRVGVGDRPIGYLYNLVHAGRVHAYQSGFRYAADPRLKPGLVSHYLAVQHNLAAGAEVYDFMAGAARHKQSLGTATATLSWLALQHPRVKLRLEQGLRRLKRSLFK